MATICINAPQGACNSTGCEIHVQQGCSAGQQGGTCCSGSGAAGNLSRQDLVQRLRGSEHVKESLKWCTDDDSLTCVQRKFHNIGTGEVGKPVVHYGSAEDCDIPATLVHGIKSKKLENLASLVNPPPKSWAVQKSLELDERIYDSNKYGPVGKSHNQLDNLPASVHPDITRFGIQSETDIDVGTLLNWRCNACDPCKPVTCPSLNTHPPPGYQTDRRYSNHFIKSALFGIPTPNDKAGRFAKKIMYNWRTCSPDKPFVNKTYAEHLDMRRPKLGLPQDRLKIARTKGHCFDYGTRKITGEPDPPIGQVIFNRCPDTCKDSEHEIMRDLKNWLGMIRKKIKGSDPELELFYEHVKACENGDGITNMCNPAAVPWEVFMRAFQASNLPCLVNEERFKTVLQYFGIYHPCPCDRLNINAFMDLVKAHNDPMFPCYSTDFSAFHPPHSNGCIHYRTTYSDFAGYWCDKCRPNPLDSFYKRKNPAIGNYDDAYSLIWPSYYTQRGISIKDAYAPRTRDQMRKVFCDARACVSYEDLEKGWEDAEKRDPKCKQRVCFQTLKDSVCTGCNCTPPPPCPYVCR